MTLGPSMPSDPIPGIPEDSALPHSPPTLEPLTYASHYPGSRCPKVPTAPVLCLFPSPTDCPPVLPWQTMGCWWGEGVMSW